MFTLAKLAQFTDTETKNFQQILPKIPYGASGGSRNLISSLENLHTNRCTTLAYLGWDIGLEPTTFWTTIRCSNQLS